MGVQNIYYNVGDGIFLTIEVNQPAVFCSAVC